MFKTIARFVADCMEYNRYTLKKDAYGEKLKNELSIQIESRDEAICIYADGFESDFDSTGLVAMLEVLNNELRLVVWSDPHKEDPVIIPINNIEKTEISKDKEIAIRELE